MILFCGIPSEPPLALAIQAAEALGLEHVVYNQRHARFNDVVVDVRDGCVTGAIWMWEREYRLEQFRGVYTRLVESAALPESQSRGRHAPDPRAVEKATFMDGILGQWLEVAECPVLNRAAAAASNGSKPYQAQLIAASGFRVPATLVTNDPAEVRAFARTHGRVIYKSTSSVRSIVQELAPDTSDAALARVRSLPTQFQELVAGTDVRVHVVGDALFATEICSAATDYRYAGRDGLDVAMTTITLPGDVADRCVSLARRLALPFCGIDLKRTAAGEYVCFEVNPSPAYSYYQEHTGQPIAQAVVCYLAGQES